MILCKICKTETSPTWWKCCPQHTTEQGLDVVCKLCASKCITSKEIVYDRLMKEAIMKDLQNLIEGMDLPDERQKDIRWLSRNLGVRNSDHPNFKEASEHLKELLKGE